MRQVTHTEFVDLEGKDIVRRLDDAWELVGLVASSHVRWLVGRGVRVGRQDNIGKNYIYS